MSSTSSSSSVINLTILKFSLKMMASFHCSWSHKSVKVVYTYSITLCHGCSGNRWSHLPSPEASWGVSGNLCKSCTGVWDRPLAPPTNRTTNKWTTRDFACLCGYRSNVTVQDFWEIGKAKIPAEPKGSATSLKSCRPLLKSWNLKSSI